MGMITCREVANDLRKLADALETAPDLKVPQMYMSFHMGTNKESVLSLVKLLPRPLTKTYRDDELKLHHDSPGAELFVYIPRKAVCEMVEPAKPAVYRCDPLLSEEEEVGLGVEK